MGYAKGWTDVAEIDWDKVDSGAPTPVEPGIYAGVIVKAEAKKTKSSGKPSIAIEVQIESAFDSDEEVRGKVFDNLTLTEEAAFKMKQLCEAVELMDYLKGKMAYDDIVELAKEMTGQEIWVKLSVRTYQGRNRNSIDEYIHEDEVDEKAASLNDMGGTEDNVGTPVRKSRRSKGRSNGKADAEVEDKPKGRRRAAAAEDTEDIKDEKDEKDEDEKEEEAPRRARRRRPRS